MKIESVQALMQTEITSVQCQTPLAEIVNTLINNPHTQLPVINQNKKLIGMVSVMDCQKALLVGAYHCDQPVKVNDIMANSFISLQIDEPLSEVANRTLHQAEDIFPVVADGKLLGLLKRVDLLAHLHNNFSQCSTR